MKMAEEAKRNRKANFTVAECSLILEQAEKDIDIIKSKFSSVITNKKKTHVWEDITAKVNSLGVCVRSVQEVKDKWRGMISNARKEHCKINKDHRKTGGGEKPTSPKSTTTKIIDLFGEDPSFSGISGGFDSAEIITAASSTSLFNTIEANVLDDLDIHEIMPSQDLPLVIEGASLPEISVISMTDTAVRPSKKRKSSTIMDEINEVHLEVLNKESRKLDLEIENLLLSKRKLMLEIEEFERKRASERG